MKPLNPFDLIYTQETHFKTRQVNWKDSRIQTNTRGNKEFSSFKQILSLYTKNNFKIDKPRCFIQQLLTLPHVTTCTKI